MTFTYDVIRSDRKTLAVSIKGDKVIVRAPRRISDKKIKEFVAEYEQWIATNLEKSMKRLENADKFPVIGDEEMKTLKKQAAEYIPHRVKHYADLMGVEYGRIAIRSQKTKWGSCSSKRNLNFNCLLMLTPNQVIDSVVVHELCHLRHMDHSPAFYAEVRKIFPEYNKWNNWLKENGSAIMSRVVE